MQRPRRHRQGFSLIQLSILLTAAALVMVAVLPSSQTALTGNNLTNKKMNAVLAALRDYQVANGTLPCPADQTMGMTNASFGAANTSASCATANLYDSTNHTAVGMVPVRALSLSNDFAIDGFGHEIDYGVDTNATSCWSATSMTGNVLVDDNGTVTHSLLALASHGSDGHGAWLPNNGSGGTGTASQYNSGSSDSDQLLNAHLQAMTFTAMTTSQRADEAANTVTFVKKPPVSGLFDDLVVYNNPLWNFGAMPAAQIAIEPTLTYPASGGYGSGQSLTFTLTYPSNVTVTGTPRIDLAALGSGSIGTSNAAYATYTGGTGTTTLTFSYTVQASDSAPNGIYITKAAIDLNGGTVSGCPIVFSVPNLSGVIISLLAVADWGNSRMETFTSSGSFLLSFGTSGSGNGQFNQPIGVAVDQSGNIWVGDWGNNRVQEFNASGTWTQSIPASGTTHSVANGHFYNPGNIAIDSSGNVWIADGNNNRVVELNSSGSYVSKFGTFGTAAGQFSYLVGMPLIRAAACGFRIPLIPKPTDRDSCWGIPRRGRDLVQGW